MIPAGYLLKRAVATPPWLLDPQVQDICNVAACVGDNPFDPSDTWQHNGYGLANSPEVLTRIARDADSDVADLRLFYYEVYEREIESDGWDFQVADWRPLTLLASSSVPPNVTRPAAPSSCTQLGFDVVTSGDFLEHSPLVCNGLTKEIGVNKYGLVDTLVDAVSLIDTGAFGGGCEEGIYRVFSVALMHRS